MTTRLWHRGAIDTKLLSGDPLRFRKTLLPSYKNDKKESF